MRVRLEDVCEKESSKLKQSDVIDQNGLYPVYGASGYLGNINTYQQLNYYVAVVKDGAGIGRTMLLPPKSSIIGTMQYLIPKDNILPEYLYYVVKAKHLEKYFSGATIPHIYFKDYKNEQFDLVSFEEQREIINRIKKIETIIDNLSKNLVLLDELVRARFVEMFGDNKYDELAVKKVCTSIVDCPHTTPKYNGDLRNPAIRTSEIKKGFITWDTMKYVSDEEYIERTARLKPQQGDIVYGREGTFGNAAILPKGYNFCLGQRVMLLRPNNEFCISQYLLRALISDEVYNQALAKNNASTVAHVNVKDVKNFMIPVPPLELQNQFASFVEEIDKSRSRIQKSLEASQELFDSLMQEYFG